VAEDFSGRLLFVALGEEAPPERIGRAEIRFVPFQREPGQVARYYQAADVYAHAARADTFPNTILEALACGTPVVATAVCGIPEQVRGLRHPAADPQESSYPPERATGLLVPPGDAAALAAALGHLLGHDSLRERLGENAHADACRRFGLDLQVEAYLEWYQNLQARPGALRLAQARGA
jgi:glycosyltransferase involved in cell wall biosynthesis